MIGVPTYRASVVDPPSRVECPVSLFISPAGKAGIEKRGLSENKGSVLGPFCSYVLAGEWE